jgi:hypothetical protein
MWLAWIRLEAISRVLSNSHRSKNEIEDILNEKARVMPGSFFSELTVLQGGRIE